MRHAQIIQGHKSRSLNLTMMPLLSKLFVKQSVRKSPPIGEDKTAYNVNEDKISGKHITDTAENFSTQAPSHASNVCTDNNCLEHQNVYRKMELVNRYACLLNQRTWKLRGKPLH